MKRFPFARVISASLSPNAEADDVFLSWRMLFTPWAWRIGNAPGRVELWARTFFDVPCAVTFNSGRSALYALLKAFHIGKGAEVVVQAFTCVAVPNSVRWAGATPVFADIDATLNLDPSSVAKKISPKTKAIIVQHTFGVPAAIGELSHLAKKHKLLLIEDCAHSLGAKVEGKKVGTFGDAAFFSFGRDKILSSVFGGLAIIDTKHKEAIEELKAFHKKLDYPSHGWVFQQLFHPIAFSLILPLYRLHIGKAILVLFQRLHLLGFPVYKEEKAGGRPNGFPSKYPHALAVLLLRQIKKLDRFTKERQATAAYYVKQFSELNPESRIQFREGAAYLRFPLLMDNPDAIRVRAKEQGVLLGNWYHNVIDPTGTALATVGYKPGSCPKAERIAKLIINLPTRIKQQEAKAIVEICNQ